MSNYQSFRDFLSALDANGQLVSVHDAVIPEPGIRTYLRAAADIGDEGPALLFDNIIGYKGMRVAGNVHGSWANHAVILGMDKKATIREQFFEVNRLWESTEGEFEEIGRAHV